MPDVILETCGERSRTMPDSQIQHIPFSSHAKTKRHKVPSRLSSHIFPKLDICQTSTSIFFKPLIPGSLPDGLFWPASIIPVMHAELRTLIFLVYLLAGFSLSCSPSESYAKRVADLQAWGADLQARHEQIDRQVDSLWDVTSAQLAASIPVDFPPLDRSLFVEARNADHIRMFKSFESLDPSIRQLVIDAGAYDQKLAQEMHALAAEQLEFDRARIELLQALEEQDPKTREEFARMLRAVPDPSFSEKAKH